MTGVCIHVSGGCPSVCLTCIICLLRSMRSLALYAGPYTQSYLQEGSSGQHLTLQCEVWGPTQSCYHCECTEPSCDSATATTAATATAAAAVVAAAAHGGDNTLPTSQPPRLPPTYVHHFHLGGSLGYWRRRLSLQQSYSTSNPVSIGIGWAITSLSDYQ